MDYIVLDLEWNQPTSFRSSAYRTMGDKLLFEVIQFGAAKVNEKMEIYDTISVPVRPTYYLTIHPRIRRITGLSHEVLGTADTFPEAVNTFREWCGEDCSFLTWGGDDISVLAQNLDCFGVKMELPKMYDLQRLYSAEAGKKGQTALKTAMEELDIDEEEDRPFHNAMHDAYYTARVFQKLPHPESIFSYEEHARKLAHTERRDRLRVTNVVPSVTEALKGELLNAPKCPTCEGEMALRTELIYQAPGKYIALCRCPRHGMMLLKARFMRLKNGQTGLNLCISPSTEQSRAYVHTKELQFQMKRKRGDFDGLDPEALPGLNNSNLPFEETV